MNVSKVAKSGLGYTQTGTPYYASPEVWMNKPYSNKSDIWSLGCVLYESITLKPPYRSDSMEGLFKKVLNGLYPQIPKHFSKELGSVVSKMIVNNPLKRPSCQQLLDLSIIQKKIDVLFDLDLPTTDDQLLQTITVPKNLQLL